GFGSLLGKALKIGTNLL
uniref:Caerulein precursor fragment-related peptide R2 n=1 Tax=Xenopus ruwenzoriensis TaxID=105430 RepID=CRR2_XENRU|nr:RecName: Full=Caerulein precursor fragment-related peptide R2; AltName: Full=CPF-RP-R2 [Xenopus ruwenzoriensis]